MSDDCLSTEELAACAQGGGTDMQRRHLEACPRCESFVLTYAEFLKPTSPLSDDEVRDARQRLGEFLEREVATPLVASGAATHTSAPSASASEHRTGVPRRPRTLGILLRRPPRAAWVVAASALILAGVWRVHLMRADRERPVVLRQLRPQGPSEGVGQILLHPVQADAPGGIGLAWDPVRDADAYEIRLMTPDLSREGKLGPITTTTHVLTRKEVAGALAGGEASAQVLVKVVALRRGAPIALSHVVVLSAPE